MKFLTLLKTLLNKTQNNQGHQIFFRQLKTCELSVFSTCTGVNKNLVHLILQTFQTIQLYFKHGLQ